MARGERTSRTGRTGRSGRGTSVGSGLTPDLNSYEGLKRLAESKGIEEPKQNKALSALRHVAGILNTGSAFTSGLVAGAMDPKKGAIGTAFERAGKSFRGEELQGFTETIRQATGEPTTRTGKVMTAVGGFVADVVFDPLTYMTFGLGAGIKLGTGTLSKSGTKMALAAEKQIVRQYGKKASRITRRMFEQATGKKGLTKETAEEFIKRGFDKGTVQTLRELGPTLLDRGGIKFFGKTLVSSKTLAKTPVGKAAKRLGETEIAVAVKNTLGRTFVSDFGRNKKVVDILDKAGRMQRTAMKQIIEDNKKLFSGLTDDQTSEFFNTVFEKKLQIIKKDEEIQQQTIEQINKLFPELGVKDPEKAKQVLSVLEEITQKQVSTLRKRIDKITEPLFKDRLAAQRQGALRTGKDSPFDKIDNMQAVIAGLRTQLRELRGAQNVAGNPALAAGLDMSPESLEVLQKRLIFYQEEKLADTIDSLSRKLQLAKEGATPGAGKRVKAPKTTALETVAFAEKQIQQLQSSFADKEKLLQKIVGSRREAKKLQKGERLLFADKKLQDVSDKLFEGDDAIVERFRKIAGIEDEDAIKFYIPSVFKDKLAVKDFAMGRNMSGPNLNFKKKFTGKVDENLIQNPFEAYSLGQIRVTNARIKSNAVDNVITKLGRPIESMTAKEAGEKGYVKWGRQHVQGVNNRAEGWIKKDLAEELNKFAGRDTGNLMDDLAKNLGFDWSTGLFKSYVTSLFPAFHARNITSNQFQNMLKIGMDVANPMIQSDALKVIIGKGLDKEIVTKSGQKISLKKLRQIVEKESDILDEGAFSRAEALIDDSAKELVKGESRVQKFNPLSRDNIALKFGRAIGTKAEQQAKMVNIISAVQSGKTVKEGIKQAEEALFNYSKLTDFERTVLRRMIPFYTFARKNAELQIKTLARSPGKVAAQMKLIDNAGKGVGEPITQEDIEGLPSFILDGLGIKGGAGLKNKYGQDVFFTGFGLPIEEFLGHFSGDKGIVSNAVAEIVSLSNPLLKFPVERATGQDFFRQRPIVEITNATSMKGMFDAMPEPVAKEFKELINYHEKEQTIYANGKKVGTKTVAVANPFVLHVMRNLFTSRIQSTVGFLSSEEESGYSKALRAFTGVRGWTIDQEYQKFINESKNKENLSRWLDDIGVINKFERFYEEDTFIQ